MAETNRCTSWKEVSLLQLSKEADSELEAVYFQRHDRELESIAKQLT